MKPTILCTAIAGLLSASIALQAEEGAVQPKPATGVITIQGAANGPVVLSKDGKAGTFTITGGETVTGATTVSGGTPTGGTIIVTAPAKEVSGVKPGNGPKWISVGNASAVTAGSGTLTVGAPSGGSVSTATATTNADGTATITINVNGKEETHTFKLGDGAGTLTLTGSNTITGTTTANAPLNKEAWAGVALGSTDALPGELKPKTSEGIAVLTVVPESPAAKAGLEVNDVLTRFDDQILLSADQFRTLVKMRKPGESVKLVYFRKGERKETQVTLAERNAAESGHVGAGTLTINGSAALTKEPGARHGRIEFLREKLKDAKERFPGIVVDKQTFILGVDGAIKKIEGELGDLDGALKTLREELEKADIPKEKIEAVRKSIQDLIESAGDAGRKAALKAIQEYQARKEEKTPGQQ